MWVSSSSMAETSVAMPHMDRQSGRFGVISQSITVSLMPFHSTKSTPTGASFGRIMMPEWSASSPSSRLEQFMPNESTPRSLPFLIFMSPGSVAPTSAVTVLSPTSKFWAPHTTCSGQGSPFSSTLYLPTSILQTYMWSESGWGTFSSTWDVTTRVMSAPTRSTASTSVPVRTNSLTRSWGSSGTSTMVLSHS